MRWPIRKKSSRIARTTAEKGGGAEGRGPAVSEDQVEAQRGDREDHDAAEQIDVERLIQDAGDHRDKGERDHADHQRHRSWAARHALSASAPWGTAPADG